MLKELPIAISFVYGEFDFVKLYEEDAPERVCEANADKEHSNVYMLAKSGHNFHFDNPEEMNKIILNVLLDESNATEGCEFAGNISHT